MTDFSVVHQLIGTRSPIRKLVFPLLANCPAPEVRKEFRILCVSPHDRHIAHLLTIAYTEYQIMQRIYEATCDKKTRNVTFLILFLDKLDSYNIMVFRTYFLSFGIL